MLCIMFSKIHKILFMPIAHYFMCIHFFCIIVEEAEAEKQKIIDMTETNLVGLRRTIYLTLQSSLDFEEAAHKLLRLQLKPGQEGEMCNMVLDCGAQQRTYEKFYGLLAHVSFLNGFN